MFRRFRRGRRGKEKDANTTSTTTTMSTSHVVPEKSPNAANTPPARHGRRRQRGTPVTTASASPTTSATSSPPAKSQQPSTANHQHVASSADDMSSSHLNTDMLEQLEAEVTEFPFPVGPQQPLAQLPQTPQTSSTTTETAGPTTTTTTTATTLNQQSSPDGVAPIGRPRTGTTNQRSLAAARRAAAQAEAAAADSGCLPRTRGGEAEPRTGNGRASRGSRTSATPEQDAERWNRVTKEAAEWDRRGTGHFEKGDYEQAFMCYEKALTLKRSTLKPADVKDDDRNASSEASLLASVATSINNMTYLRQRAGQATADETMAAYLQSLQMKREILGPHHLSVGKTLNNIGSVFYLQREYAPALKAYLQAFGIMGDQLGPTHLDVGTVLSNIGDVYFAMGNKHAAKEKYRKALDIRWGALGPSDPKVVRLMEQLAFLETGKQPSKDEEDLSDSENEEFAVADRLRHERFQEEVKVLQDELAEDMKFFDLLERKMAIDMVRDKTRMFRKMRQLTNLGLDELMEASESNYTDASESEISVATAPVLPLSLPHHPPQTEQMRRARTLDDLPETPSGTFLADTNHMLPPPKGHVDTVTVASSSATSFLERTNAMSKEERAEALVLVRERLAALRAAREKKDAEIQVKSTTILDKIGKGEPENMLLSEHAEQVQEEEENEEEYKAAESAGWVPQSLPTTIA